MNLPTAAFMLLALTSCQYRASTTLVSEIEVRDGRVHFAGRSWPCAIGRNGTIPAVKKREGDGCTPTGRYPLRTLYYRTDKLSPPSTALPLSPIHTNDGWCDDPAHPAYNTKVTLPFPASHERLWREDDLYDLVAVIGYNDSPPAPSRGSAIFLHVAKADYQGTAGCVALSKRHLLELLSLIPKNVKILIH